MLGIWKEPPKKLWAGPIASQPVNSDNRPHEVGSENSCMHRIHARGNRHSAGTVAGGDT